MKETLTNALAYIAGRMKEPSTYPALMLIATAIGHWSTTDVTTKQQILMDIGLFVAGLIGAALPDRIGKNTRASDTKPEVQPETKEPT